MAEQHLEKEKAALKLLQATTIPRQEKQHVQVEPVDRDCEDASERVIEDEFVLPWLKNKRKPGVSDVKIEPQKFSVGLSEEEIEKLMLLDKTSEKAPKIFPSNRRSYYTREEVSFLMKQ